LPKQLLDLNIPIIIALPLFVIIINTSMCFYRHCLCWLPDKADGSAASWLH